MCPHCKRVVGTITRDDLGCQILRCAALNYGQQQFDQHATIEEIQLHRRRVDFVGCGLPFQFDRRRSSKIPWALHLRRYSGLITDEDVRAGDRLFQLQAAPMDWVMSYLFFASPLS